MKRIKDFLLVYFLVMIIGITVHADGLDYYITNMSNYDKVDSSNVINVKRGDLITVFSVIDNKDGVSDYQLKSGKLTVRWDEGFIEIIRDGDKYFHSSGSPFTDLEFKNVDKITNKITINDFSSNILVPSGKSKLVEFNFRVSENARAGETKIYQMDGEDSLYCINMSIAGGVDAPIQSSKCADSLYSEIKYNIQKSDVNTLSSLKIDGSLLDNFNEDNNLYEIEMESDKVNIEAVKKDLRSTLMFDNGEKTLKYGLNTFEIIVKSEEGKENIYRLNITRIDKRSDDNTLKKLTIDPIEINFNPTVLEYTLNVENDVNKFTIDGVLSSDKARFVAGYGNREVDLDEGSNKVLIKIISEKEEERIYTLNINRALSSNTSLKRLKVNDEIVELKEEEFIYNLIFDNEVEEVIVTAIPNDEKAVIDVKEKYLLDVGDNEIIVNITAPSGAKAKYILNINRKKQLSSNSKLVNLKITGYELAFNPEVTLYNLKINDETSELEIYTTKEDEFATVEIEGNKDLHNGSIIKVNVKAEDGTYTRYFINIEKNEKSGISLVIVIIIILLLMTVACIIIIFIRKKKSDEKKQFKELNSENNIIHEEKSIDNNAFDNETDNNVETSNLEDTPNNIVESDISSIENNADIQAAFNNEENNPEESSDIQNKNID